ncbi:hypothetical protein [Streptomyces gobiensis]|uniref:hypothetical protein n=1 Tax=Streptomyces gobiensis TaxID=2875706 RepID=UPI001E2E7AE1|nr:hypothetical protein [Streptomyces gobiensis]UGY92423.1 hypothetical protein test1122_12290 [Streptomyces gobiensis]
MRFLKRKSGLTIGAAAVISLLMPMATASAESSDSWNDYSEGSAPRELKPADSADATDAKPSSRLVPPAIPPATVDGARFGTAKTPQAVSGNAVRLAPGEVPQPRAYRTDSARTAADDDWSTVVCTYTPTTVDASPAPPAQGNQYPLARASAANLYGFAQSFDSQGGFGQTEHTSKATINYDLAINIGANWPQPSQITGFVNPSFDGAARVKSNHSPFTFAQSKATGGEKIQLGIARDNDARWQTPWDLSLTRNDGTTVMERWNWPGYNDGRALYANIDSTPGHQYHFTVRTETTSTSSPIFGAGASAQTDFGSAGLDAPSLGEGYFFRANDQSQFVIQYKLPKGWGTSC